MAQFSDHQDAAQHDLMVSLVERVLNLHKQLATSMNVREKTMLSRQIQVTDAQIDSLVYELYGLTKDNQYNKRKFKEWRKIECIKYLHLSHNN